MPVTTQKAAPYAPPSGILEIIDRYRNHGLPVPINGEVLGRAGVSDSLIARTLQALHVLDLTEEDGVPTEVLKGLRLASESEFKQRLQEWLKAAYADVFSYVDPAKDDEVAVRDAFRSYQPAGQQPRMVTLFLGLCSAAGLAPEKSVKPRKRVVTGRIEPITLTMRQSPKKRSKNVSSDIPPPLAGLLASLPPEGQEWTKSQREKFVETFEAVLDFCFPIAEDEPKETPESAKTSGASDNNQGDT